MSGKLNAGLKILCLKCTQSSLFTFHSNAFHSPRTVIFCFFTFSLPAPKHTSCSSLRSWAFRLIHNYNVGKTVYHTGEPGAKTHTYTSSIPALSPPVLMDFMQMLWRVRQQSRTKCPAIRTRSKLNSVMGASFQ